MKMLEFYGVSMKTCVMGFSLGNEKPMKISFLSAMLDNLWIWVGHHQWKVHELEHLYTPYETWFMPYESVLFMGIWLLVHIHFVSWPTLVLRESTPKITYYLHNFQYCALFFTNNILVFYVLVFLLLSFNFLPHLSLVVSLFTWLKTNSPLPGVT